MLQDNLEEFACPPARVTHCEWHMARCNNLNCVASAVVPMVLFGHQFWRVHPRSNETFVIHVHFVCVHFVQWHADQTVHCVVWIDELLQHINISLSVFRREIVIHRFQHATEVLDHTCFHVFVLQSVKMYVVMMQHLPKGRLQKFHAFVHLKHSTSAAIGC